MRTQRALLLFESGIRAEATRKQYRTALSRFMEFCKIESYDVLANIEAKEFQIKVEDYLMAIRTRYHYSSLNAMFSAIQLFCTMNDVLINWKKIRKMFPEKEKPTGDRAYTVEEIRSLLDQVKSYRYRALIHLLASSGVRAGAVHEMQLKDLTDMPNGCKSLKVYPNTKDEYTTFISPECVYYLDKYHNERKAHGEKLFENSYLFMTDLNKKFLPEYVSITMCRLCRKLKRKLASDLRYEIMSAHGFRKRFNTIVKMRNDVNINLAERLLGHSRTIKLDNNYFRPTTDQLFTEYLKALPDLMINVEYRLKEEIKLQKKEIEELRNQDERILILETQLEQFKNLSKQL